MTDKEFEILKQSLLGLTTEEQLQVSQLLLDELYEKSETYGWNNQTYEADRINHIVYLLNMYVSGLKKDKKREEMLETIEKINGLSDDKKKRVVNAAFREAHKIEKEDNKRRAEEECRSEGHIFSGKNEGWESRKYSSYEKIYPGDHLVLDGWVEHTEWSRTCTRCGIVEKMLDKEPEVVTKAKHKEKVKRRKEALLRELKALEIEE